MPPPRPAGRWVGEGHPWAGCGGDVWGSRPLGPTRSYSDLAPRTASMLALDQGLYDHDDHVLISCHRDKTGFKISPIFMMKRLRPNLPPLAPSYRLPATKVSELVAKEGTMGLLYRRVRDRQEGNEGTGAPGLRKPKKLSLGDPKGQATETQALPKHK